MVIMPASTVTHPEMNSKPSKSAKKRETHALQHLGEQLIDLSAEQLLDIGLDDILMDAIVAAKSIRAHGALRRQKQLIGKLMRRVDPDPITAALEQYNSNKSLEKSAFRQAEQWRERITSDTKSCLNAFNTAVGHDNSDLTVAVQEWSAAHDDKERQLASRKIFREVHKDLLSMMQNQADSI
jgi:ribosome-associated protein